MLAGNKYLVTGSTDGIGRHTAEKLYRAGADVFIHGRSAAKVEQVVDFLTAHGGDGGGKVTPFIADLSSFAEVRRLAAQVKDSLVKDGSSLTALVNNAGVFEDQRRTSDGYELTWAVNVAAPYLLTSLLLDTISERIINVASISAAVSIDFNNLQQERGFSSHGAYSLSKLCNIMFSMELAERISLAALDGGGGGGGGGGSGGSSSSSTFLPALPTSNALDPGTVNTKMLFAGWGPIGIRVDQANDQFHLATDSRVAGVSGKYFVSRRERTAPGPANDVAARRKLWDLLQEQTGAVWRF